MPTVEEFTEPFLGIYAPPAAAGSGVCDVCHGVTGVRQDGGRFTRCWSCQQTVGGVAVPVRVVVPISLYRVGEQLHTVLKDYKRSPNPRVRERHLWQVAATLHRFIFNHRAHIAAAGGGAWDVVTTVPSKAARAGAHPLEQAMSFAEPLASEHQRLLDRDHPELIGRFRPNDAGFKTSRDVNGLRVLLVDDTFTSGATFQSAASRLGLDGATVVAGVVIGRVIDTTDATRPEKLAFWEQQRNMPFTFARCCLEG